MKSIGANLATHLAGEVLTLARCWKVTRTDGQVFGFTDHDRDLVVSSVTYTAASGFNASDIATSGDLGVDNLQVDGILQSAQITEADLLAGKWDNATVEVFLVNYKAIADGTLKLRKGRIGEVRADGTRFVAELRGLAHMLQQVIGEVYTAGCRADLFDARCGLNAASFKVTGTVTSFSGRSQFTDTTRTEASNYFRGGKVKWTSGANNGLTMEIKSHDGGTDTFTLVLPMPFAIANGDAYEMWPGCDKTLADCQSKFGASNIVNFRGEPYVPGMDKWTSGTA